MTSIRIKQRFTTRNAVPAMLLCLATCALIGSTGCVKATYGPIGHGWPSQCGHVEEVRDEREAEGFASLPTDEPGASIDVAAYLDQDALSRIGDIAVEKIETQLNADGGGPVESLSPFIDESVDIAWDLSLAAIQPQQFDQLTVLLIDFAVSADVSVISGGDEAVNTTIRGSGVIAAVVALDAEDGVTRIILDGRRSEIHNVQLGDEGNRDLGDELASVLVDALKAILVTPRGTIALASLSPLPLGETGVQVLPRSLHADESGNILVVHLSTNIGSDAAPPTFDPETNQIAITLEPTAVSKLIQAQTNSIGGTSVDDEAQSGGKIRLFTEDVELHDGYLTLVQTSYSGYGLCAHARLELDARIAFVDGEPLVTIFDRRVINASRQRWLIRKKAPSLEQMSQGLTASLRADLASAPLSFEGDSEDMTLVPASIEIHESGLIIALELGETTGQE